MPLGGEHHSKSLRAAGNTRVSNALYKSLAGGPISRSCNCLEYQLHFISCHPGVRSLTKCTSDGVVVLLKILLPSTE